MVTDGSLRLYNIGIALGTGEPKAMSMLYTIPNFQVQAQRRGHLPPGILLGIDVWEGRGCAYLTFMGISRDYKN